jgi:beta-glucanase (GH16 family)
VALAVIVGGATERAAWAVNRPKLPESRPAEQPLEKPGWTLTFHDEFDGPELDRDNWITFYRGNSSLPAHYVIRDGMLHLRMDRDAPPPRSPGSNDRVSGIETRRAGKPFAQQYGWFELRARCCKGSGMQSAWWMTPIDSAYDKITSEGGTRKSAREATEIDIFEQLGREPEWNNFTVHYGSATSHGSDARHVKLPFSLTDEFHVYAFDWDAQRMIWYVDGREVHRSDKVPHNPFFLRLSFYEGDNAWRGNVDPADPYPKDFVVDYIRVYRKAEPRAKSP